MQIIKGSITNVNGITALGMHIGIKRNKLDFAVICSDKRCNAAAVYTKNRVKGAPLKVTMEHLKDGKAQAIVVNSGIANACTGKRGIEDAKAMAQLAASELGIKAEDVLVASTGVIGAYLPMEKIRKGIKGIKKQLSKKHRAAEAILTTDTVKKEICIMEDNFTIGAIAKGAGMIHPNMATMLCFICTDAKIPTSKLRAMLKQAVDDSFNMMTVDMDTSTSDMCVILANGYAGKVDECKFQLALTKVCAELAKKIAADGEGATKLIQVDIKNAKDKAAAKKLAKSIVSSNLFKCAVYGNDPNWGRILCAMGNSGAEFDESKADIYIGGKMVVKNGKAVNFSQSKIKKAMGGKKVEVLVDLRQGDGKATAYGCDMSERYVKINAHYPT
jgi:glutamate N-acetyltransferase/amino-acid N-acetyltransferase